MQTENEEKFTLEIAQKILEKGDMELLPEIYLIEVYKTCEIIDWIKDTEEELAILKEEGCNSQRIEKAKENIKTYKSLLGYKFCIQVVAGENTSLEGIDTPEDLIAWVMENCDGFMEDFRKLNPDFQC